MGAGGSQRVYPDARDISRLIDTTLLIKRCCEGPRQGNKLETSGGLVKLAALDLSAA